MASPNAKHFLSLCLYYIDIVSLAKAIPIAKVIISMGRTPRRHGYKHGKIMAIYWKQPLTYNFIV